MGAGDTRSRDYMLRPYHLDMRIVRNMPVYLFSILPAIHPTNPVQRLQVRSLPYLIPGISSHHPPDFAISSQLGHSSRISYEVVENRRQVVPHKCIGDRGTPFLGFAGNESFLELRKVLAIHGL